MIPALTVKVRFGRQWVRFPSHLAPVQDGLFVGFAYGTAHVWLLVLQLLCLVEARVNSERLKLWAWQPLPTRIITLLTTKKKGDVLPRFNISFFKKSLDAKLLWTLYHMMGMWNIYLCEVWLFVKLIDHSPSKCDLISLQSWDILLCYHNIYSKNFNICQGTS